MPGTDCKLVVTFVFFILSVCNLKSQSLEEIIAVGDTLYKRGEIDASLNEYNRALFFSDNEHKAAINSKIAGCYVVLMDLDLAESYCDSALLHADDAETKILYELSRIECMILDNGFIRAIREIGKLQEGLGNPVLIKRKYYLTAVCYYGMSQFDSAFFYFDRCLDIDDFARKEDLLDLQGKVKGLQMPNPVAASVFSAILPGAGQTYAGFSGEGINSLGLLAAIAFLGFYTPFIDGFFVIPFLYRYYMGGIVHANDLACRKRIEKQSELYLEITNLFQEKGLTAGLFQESRKEVHPFDYCEHSFSLSGVLATFSFLFYKEFISSQDVDACVFNPSCSVYTIEAISKHGSIIGMLMGLDRMMRCHSFVNDREYPLNPILNKYEDEL
jgi:putative component of membrane protein insertase Oxa1/YidC/SpoIIIJ protein YidD/tetratricopeptide (TPR) repeat protein